MRRTTDRAQYAPSSSYKYIICTLQQYYNDPKRLLYASYTRAVDVLLFIARGKPPRLCIFLNFFYILIFFLSFFNQAQLHLDANRIQPAVDLCDV